MTRSIQNALTTMLARYTLCYAYYRISEIKARSEYGPIYKNIQKIYNKVF